MSTEVPVDAPWESPNGAEWDEQTLATYIADNSDNAKFRALIPLATRAIFGAEPRDLSLLFTLFYIAASGNEDNPGHLRAQLQHPAMARRCGVSPAARSGSA